MGSSSSPLPSHHAYLGKGWAVFLSTLWVSGYEDTSCGHSVEAHGKGQGHQKYKLKGYGGELKALSLCLPNGPDKMAHRSSF